MWWRVRGGWSVGRALGSLCLLAFLSLFKPSEAYLVEYFVLELGVPASVVDRDVFPLWSYSVLVAVLLLGFLADALPARFPIAGGTFGAVVTAFVLLVVPRVPPLSSGEPGPVPSSTMFWLKLEQVTVAFSTAAFIVALAFLYSAVPSSAYARGAAFMRAAYLAGTVTSAVLGQVLLVWLGVSLRLLLTISLVSMALATLVALFLIPPAMVDLPAYARALLVGESAASVNCGEDDGTESERVPEPALVRLRGALLALRAAYAHVGLTSLTVWNAAFSAVHMMFLTYWQVLFSELRAEAGDDHGADHRKHGTGAASSNGVIYAIAYVVAALAAALTSRLWPGPAKAAEALVLVGAEAVDARAHDDGKRNTDDGDDSDDGGGLISDGSVTAGVALVPGSDLGTARQRSSSAAEAASRVERRRVVAVAVVAVVAPLACAGFALLMATSSSNLWPAYVGLVLFHATYEFSWPLANVCLARFVAQTAARLEQRREAERSPLLLQQPAPGDERVRPRFEVVFSFNMAFTLGAQVLVQVLLNNDDARRWAHAAVRQAGVDLSTGDVARLQFALLAVLLLIVSALSALAVTAFGFADARAKARRRRGREMVH